MSTDLMSPEYIEKYVNGNWHFTGTRKLDCIISILQQAKRSLNIGVLTDELVGRIQAQCPNHCVYYSPDKLDTMPTLYIKMVPNISMVPIVREHLNSGSHIWTLAASSKASGEHSNIGNRLSVVDGKLSGILTYGQEV